ncbi:MAG: trehalose-6-phosphate synthase [Casimicrobiaceae bacterium]
MRLTLRLILPLAIGLAGLAWAVVPLVDQLTFKWFVRDLDIRAQLVASTMEEPLGDLLQDRVRDRIKEQRIQSYLTRILTDERLYGIAFCEKSGTLTYRTQGFPADIGCDHVRDEAQPGHVVQHPSGPLHLAVRPVNVDGKRAGDLLILHDMSFIERRSADTKRYVYLLFLAIGAATALITTIIFQLSWRGWIRAVKGLIRGHRSATPEAEPEAAHAPELLPLAQDLQALVREIDDERRARDESQMTWVPETLRQILHEDLRGDEIMIVSNREPYIHVHGANGIEIQRPASGLVTALEPVMRACSGTWIAHGSGSADRETVDAQDKVSVPPDNPSYRIRRVWLTKEEEAGYYYGFSNEGLWPLCHFAHTRPTFRASDWQKYVEVNRRFADVVVEEARTDNPIVLVQDYHFALLPRLIRQRLPAATIITFWHSPWPNPEGFGICPWRSEILDGLLGSTVLGFHTQFHCNNFFDTVARYLEARVDRETFSIACLGQQTEVRRYPISIEWPPSALQDQPPVARARADIRAMLNLPEDAKIGVGVERLDYTKGILERFAAVERLLEISPDLVGKFCFVQIAAPSRQSIDEYQNFEARVRGAARHINDRFGRPGYNPIELRIQHHDARDVFRYCRAADFCMVTSLHDGMNLVAKEFVASRDDERGVLILSLFAGASRELVDALIVNPYDIEQTAGAMVIALRMSADEQRTRMRSMRHLVREFNVYRWAGRMLLDASRLRQRQRVQNRSTEAARVIQYRRA